MKKTMLFLLTAALALTFTACEPKEKPDETMPQAPVTTTATTASDPITESQTTEATTLPVTEESTTMPDAVAEKPVIYLYPTEEMPVSIALKLNGALTCTYPAYRDGWEIIARPDGTLTDPNTGRQYYCLYWEGITDTKYDLSRGFVVAGEETAPFLEETLATLGLTEREANEFIIYWLPRMEGNAYNLITFQTDAYTDNAPLTVTPAPDSMLRVFMAWKSLDTPIEIEPQELSSFERHGFAVVEWGGTELK